MWYKISYEGIVFDNVQKFNQVFLEKIRVSFSHYFFFHTEHSHLKTMSSIH